MLQAVEEARVGRVRVAGFSVSLDGFGAGPAQSLQDPLGKRGTELHSWVVGRRRSRPCSARAVARRAWTRPLPTARWTASVPSSLAGSQNMFGPARGEWLDDGWKGW